MINWISINRNAECITATPFTREEIDNQWLDCVAKGLACHNYVRTGLNRISNIMREIEQAHENSDHTHNVIAIDSSDFSIVDFSTISMSSICDSR